MSKKMEILKALSFGEDTDVVKNKEGEIFIWARGKNEKEKGTATVTLYSKLDDEGASVELSLNEVASMMAAFTTLWQEMIKEQ